MSVKELVYRAVERGNTHADGKALLDRAASLGATVETVKVPDWLQVSADQYARGFRQKTTYKITLPDGQFTHVYWQPARDCRDAEVDGLWYGRATQWD